MTTRPYDLSAGMWIERGGHDVWVELRGRFKRGTPDQGPSYGSGGTPGEPDSAEDIEASSDEGKHWHDVELSEGEIDRASEALMEGR